MYERKLNLLRLKFLYELRKYVYKTIQKHPKWVADWNRIKGHTSERLSQPTEDYLWSLVSYFQTFEGFQALVDHGFSVPEHYEDIIGWIQDAPTYKEYKNEVFKYIWNKHSKEWI